LEQQQLELEQCIKPLVVVVVVIVRKLELEQQLEHIGPMVLEQ